MPRVRVCSVSVSRRSSLTSLSFPFCRRTNGAGALSSGWPASRRFHQVLPWLGVGLQLTHCHSFNKHLVDTCCMPAAVLSLNGNGTMVVGTCHLLGRQDTANGPKLRTVLDPLRPSVTLGLWEGRQAGRKTPRFCDPGSIEGGEDHEPRPLGPSHHDDTAGDVPWPAWEGVCVW